jgi:hypothetical protein
MTNTPQELEKDIDFSMHNQNGEQNISELDGKFVLLEFWACGHFSLT